MRITLLLAILVLTATVTLPARNADPSANLQQQPTTTSSGADTLTGCLKGSKHQYYVVEQDGTRHTVMAKSDQDLSSHVNHKVTLTGKAESSRSGAGSDTEGHRKGFFSADSVSDEGPCKK
ncbi:MAG TPA: hypothetical protein VKB58_02885 [Terriglobales bacterium]|jgi:hypothetical protein|nr:hypothetical protein [Terriglobales bacterium]